MAKAKKIGKKMWDSLYSSDNYHIGEMTKGINLPAFNDAVKNVAKSGSIHIDTLAPFTRDKFVDDRDGKTYHKFARLTSPTGEITSKGTMEYGGAMNNSTEYSYLPNNLLKNKALHWLNKGSISESFYKKFKDDEYTNKIIDKKAYDSYGMDGDEVSDRIEELDQHMGDKKFAYNDNGVPYVDADENEAMPEHVLHTKLSTGYQEGKNFAKQLDTNFWKEHQDDIPDDAYAEIEDSYGSIVPYNFTEEGYIDSNFVGAHTMDEYRKRIGTHPSWEVTKGRSWGEPIISSAAQAHDAIGMPLHIEIGNVPEGEIGFKNKKQFIFNNPGRKYTPQEKAHDKKYRKEFAKDSIDYINKNKEK